MKSIRVALAGLWLAGGPVAAGAQEVGVFLVRGSSDLAEMDSPQGIGIGVRYEPWERFGLRVAAYRGRQDAALTTRVCQQYIPPVDCGEEAVDRTTRHERLDVSGTVRHAALGFLEVELGAGLSLNQVSGTDATASGRPSPLFVHRTLQVGALLATALRARPVTGLPLVLETGLSQHLLSLNACGAESFRDAPYCGSLSLREVRFGLAWTFGR